MDSFHRLLVSLAFLLVSVHFVNVKQEKSICIQKEIASSSNQNQATAATEGSDLSLDDFSQIQTRINTKALRRSKSTQSRKTYTAAYLFISHRNMICQQLVASKNLAILNKPHADYYLHTLKRLRI